MGSSQASPQRSSLEANATSYSNRRRGGGRRSLPIDNRPILRREPDPAADLRPQRKELAQLLAGLTSRDVAILAALDEHRYLDQEQVRQLFFDGQRHTQIRTKWLRDQHLIQRWIALQPPGWHRLHSVLLISVRGVPKDRRWRLCEPNFHWHPSVVIIAPWGAAVVAGAMDRDRRYLLELAHGASDKRSKFLRVLRANWFFVDVAAAADLLRRHGLYHWVGVSDLRYEPRAGRHLARPISDGWGRFLTPDGDITFDLDWDRADLPKHLLQRRTRWTGAAPNWRTCSSWCGPRLASDPSSVPCAVRVGWSSIPATGRGSRRWLGSGEMDHSARSGATYPAYARSPISGSPLRPSRGFGSTSSQRSR